MLVLGFVSMFLFYSKCMFFLCACQSKFIRFGFAVLLRIPELRAVCMAVPFLCLAYMGRTIDSLSGFTLFGISCISVFVFEKKKKLNELLFEKN